jgi:hypothetical protein
VKTPCNNCPFRSDRPFRGLHPERANKIATALLHDGDFPCHKTVDYSGDDGGQATPDSKRCVGAAIFLEQVAVGGMLANVQFRMAAMFGELRPNELSRAVPVYDSIEAFVAGASGRSIPPEVA